MSIRGLVSVSCHYKNQTKGDRLEQSGLHSDLTDSKLVIAERLLSWRQTSITHSIIFFFRPDYCGDCRHKYTLATVDVTKYCHFKL